MKQEKLNYYSAMVKRILNSVKNLRHVDEIMLNNLINEAKEEYYKKGLIHSTIFIVILFIIFRLVFG